MNIPVLEAKLRTIQVNDESVRLWLEHNARNGRKFPVGTYGTSKYENPFHTEWNGSTEVELFFWISDERI